MGNQHITSGTVITDTNSSALIESGGGTIIVDSNAFVFALAPGPGDAIELNDGPYTVTINGQAYSENDDGIDLVTIGSFLSKITIGKGGNVFGVSQGIETAHATNVTNAGRIKGQVDGLFEGGSGNYKISNSATGELSGALPCRSGLFSLAIFKNSRHLMSSAPDTNKNRDGEKTNVWHFSPSRSLAKQPVTMNGALLCGA